MKGFHSTLYNNATWYCVENTQEKSKILIVMAIFQETHSGLASVDQQPSLN